MQKFYRFSAWGSPAFLIRQGTPSQQKHPMCFPLFFLHPFSFVTSLAFHMPVKLCHPYTGFTFPHFLSFIPHTLSPSQPLCPGKRASFPHAAHSFLSLLSHPLSALAKRKAAAWTAAFQGMGKEWKSYCLKSLWLRYYPTKRIWDHRVIKVNVSWI